jgi:gliding motility-associated-like protein
LPTLDLSGLQGNYQISVELQWPLDEVNTNDRMDTVFNFDLSVGNPKVSTDSLCFGDELQLTTAKSKGEIQWQSSLDQSQWQNLMPGDTQQEQPLQQTFYRLAVCDAIFSDTFEVDVIKPNLTALEEKEFCSEEQQTISIKKEDSFTTLRWYADSNSNSFFYEGISLDTTLKESTTFYLAPVFLGCESEERIPLNITISCEIEIPNVFTPNGDGINDLFVYRNVDESIALQTKIFNRWGDLVSQWNGNKSWNGDGESEGLYYYEIYYGKEKITGVVSLIRD